MQFYKLKKHFLMNQILRLKESNYWRKNRIKLLNSSNGLAWLLKSEQAFLTLPKDSVDSLRLMRKKSKKFLLKSIKDGVDEGYIRNDIDPEVLIVPIMGTIHSMIGSPGKKKNSFNMQSTKINKVLNGLEIMISKKSQINK